MKNGMKVLIAVIAVVVVIIGIFAGGYNSLVKAQTAVETKQADIQTQLQRRADLIPNFVSTVKGYSKYEQETLTAVTEARAKVRTHSRFHRRTMSLIRRSQCGSMLLRRLIPTSRLIRVTLLFRMSLPEPKTELPLPVRITTKRFRAIIQ